MLTLTSNNVINLKIVYYSVGFMEQALDFLRQISKVWGEVLLIGVNFNAGFVKPMLYNNFLVFFV